MHDHTTGYQVELEHDDDVVLKVISPPPLLCSTLSIGIYRFWRIVQLSEKQLPTNPAVGRLKHMVDEVKLTVPVVADLRSGTLMNRHWEELDGVLGMDIRGQGSVTFKQMMKVTS